MPLGQRRHIPSFSPEVWQKSEPGVRALRVSSRRAFRTGAEAPQLRLSPVLSAEGYPPPYAHTVNKHKQSNSL